MSGRGLPELGRLLGHADRRIRLEAQLALAGKGKAALPTLTAVASAGQPRNRLARLHALWGLGIVGRSAPEALRGVQGLLGDADAEVRAQAARVLGDGKAVAAL